MEVFFTEGEHLESVRFPVGRNCTARLAVFQKLLQKCRNAAAFLGADQKIGFRQCGSILRKRLYITARQHNDGIRHGLPELSQSRQHPVIARCRDRAGIENHSIRRLRRGDDRPPILPEQGGDPLRFNCIDLAAEIL